MRLHPLDGQLKNLPQDLLAALGWLASKERVPVYFCGGPVRDWLLGKEPVDFDITVPDGALGFAEKLARKLQVAFVPLSEEEGVARLVGKQFSVDVSSFREGTTSIEEDLRRRDFTINAMAVPFEAQSSSFADNGMRIDPLDGSRDLEEGIIRAASCDIFHKDPLRLLRAYRFVAQFDFTIEGQTCELISNQRALICHPAGERIWAELEKIFATGNTCKTIRLMAASGLLQHLLPELAEGIKVKQPASHHLDVFNHNLEALCRVEKLILSPEEIFPQYARKVSSYLAHGRTKIMLKCAALFHDLGKPASLVIRKGKITFYNHDALGADQLATIAKRLRWSHRDSQQTALLIRHHMRPFHLNNSRKKTGITAKACLKLVRAVGDELIGLFVLALADSLAGQGPGKPAGMEEEVADLFQEVFLTYLKFIEPVLSNPLLSGRDLIEDIKLRPGPIFGKILKELEKIRVDQPDMSRREALSWAKQFCKDNNII